MAAKLVDAGLSSVEVQDVLDGLALDVRDFTPQLAYSAAALRPKTRVGGLSLGDRACLALGRGLGLPVLTADRAWAGLGLGIEVELAR